MKSYLMQNVQNEQANLNYYLNYLVRCTSSTHYQMALNQVFRTLKMLMYYHKIYEKWCE